MYVSAAPPAADIDYTTINTPRRRLVACKFLAAIISLLLVLSTLTLYLLLRYLRTHFSSSQAHSATVLTLSALSTPYPSVNSSIILSDSNSIFSSEKLGSFSLVLLISITASLTSLLAKRAVITISALIPQPTHSGHATSRILRLWWADFFLGSFATYLYTLVIPKTSPAPPTLGGFLFSFPTLSKAFSSSFSHLSHTI